MMSAETPDTNVPPGPPMPCEASLPRLSPPAPSPWSIRDLLFFFAFAVAWLLLSNFLALVGYVTLRPIMGWHIPVSMIQSNAFFAVISQTVYYVPMLTYVYFLVAVQYRLPFWAGIKWRNPTRQQALQFFLGGILLAVAIGFALAVFPDKEPFPLEQLFSSPQAALAVGLFAVLIAPFMEELIFRGVLFAIFERQVGLRFAIVSTALLFAGLHIPEYLGAWNHMLLIFVVGLAFSLARGLTGSLAPSVIFHLAYNLCLVTGLFFETQHFRALGGLPGP